MGFGDIVTPTPQLVNLSTILPDFPAAQLYAYSKETVIAEKFEAMVLLGIGNTQIKDFYDLWYLSQNFTFQGDLLCQAIIATFDRRRTPVPVSTPLALSTEFADDETKQRLAFVRKGKLSDDNLVLPQFISLLQDFLMPPTTAMVQQVKFNLFWSSEHCWHST